jgi:1,4-alpha-glucan branching enzyme
VKSEKIDSGWLEKVEEIDNIFPNIDYRVYRPL